MKYPVLFAILTAIFWGMYGPALGNARSEAGSSFKPYVALGFAYLIWGIVGGFGGMQVRGDDYSFSGIGALWGFIAGTLGAWGALTLTFAMFTGGGAMPHVVMPIVLGGAVTVPAIVSVMTVKSAHAPSPLLWIGIVIIGVGIVLVAGNTPHAAPPKKKAASEQPESADPESADTAPQSETAPAAEK